MAVQRSAAVRLSAILCTGRNARVDSTARTALPMQYSSSPLNQCVCASVPHETTGIAIPANQHAVVCLAVVPPRGTARHAAESIHFWERPCPVAVQYESSVALPCTGPSPLRVYTRQHAECLATTKVGRMALVPRSVHVNCGTEFCLSDTSCRLPSVVRSDVLYAVQWLSTRSYARSQSTPQHCSAVVRSRANPSSNASSSPNFC